MVTAILAGVALGALHAVTGPDHVAAVVPMSLDTPWKGARTGLGWGAGHGAGVVVLGALALFLREAMIVDVVAAWSELAVGALLLGIGGWVLRMALMRRPHDHDHGEPHDHTRAAFGIGTLHGTAGMGHLVGVLPAMGLPLASAAVYLLGFVLGAALAMGLVGYAAGSVSSRISPRLRPALVTVASVAAIGVGIWWVVGAVNALA